MFSIQQYTVYSYINILFQSKELVLIMVMNYPTLPHILIQYENKRRKERNVVLYTKTIERNICTHPEFSHFLGMKCLQLKSDRHAHSCVMCDDDRIRIGQVEPCERSCCLSAGASFSRPSGRITTDKTNNTYVSHKLSHGVIRS